ncbi:MAG: hypothetical protein A2Z99_18555 [Treponema sp. GWB1_62_6]|nr:MAG: hypothetical protein A2Y36_09190 [Treponema sp. GWA1_62_8]OHE64992.1 MAG: hypothetical protein A2Z99_18555 [Treponema sp. GWB1_62_6]OHE67934.1 MAG: hypothetical protein A2001_02800 [Treponema sp. GWC1_61_84]OHE69506.1 MAG: hypothetical protein A2413_14035 [Treponema sp. RIFOXYC1_FULL_61_9]HCM25111.1 thioredoxin [Treponema sp.]
MHKRILPRGFPIIIAAALALGSCGSRAAAEGTAPAGTGRSETAHEAPAAMNKKLTFIELGSVNCVPCKAMQPIMEEIRVKYPDQVEVIFYDVWTSAGRPYGAQYGIRVIPTQVFLDVEGKEFFRHEGFFPIEQLTQVLRQGGVKL